MAGAALLVGFLVEEGSDPMLPRGRIKLFKNHGKSLLVQLGFLCLF